MKEVRFHNKRSRVQSADNGPKFSELVLLSYIYSSSYFLFPGSFFPHWLLFVGLLVWAHTAHASSGSQRYHLGKHNDLAGISSAIIVALYSQINK